MTIIPRLLMTYSAAGGGGATYATWNPSDKGSGVTLSNGNLTGSGAEANGSVRSTIGKSSGKWYWEISSTNLVPYAAGVGVGKSSATLAHYPGFDANGWAFYGNEVKKYNSGAGVAYGSTWSNTSHVLGFALDMDAGTLEVFKNGTTMGVMYTGLTGTIYAFCGGNSTSTTNFTANFGATAFAHSVPSGYNSGLYN